MSFWNRIWKWNWSRNLIMIFSWRWLSGGRYPRSLDRWKKFWKENRRSGSKREAVQSPDRRPEKAPGKRAGLCPLGDGLQPEADVKNAALSSGSQHWFRRAAAGTDHTEDRKTGCTAFLYPDIWEAAGRDRCFKKAHHQLELQWRTLWEVSWFSSARGIQ